MSETVLFVDDDPLLREVYNSIAADAGYRVLLASNGEDAIAIFNSNIESIVLVIADVNMPNMSGTELLCYLSGLKPSLKTILTSGGSHDFGKTKTVFLQKPFTAKTLLASMHEVLGLPVVDRSILQRLTGYKSGNDSLISVLSKAFAESAGLSLNEMRSAIAKNDIRALNLAAHRLKSSSSTLGLSRITEICQTLEMAKTLTENAAQIVAALEVELKTAQTELDGL